MTRTLAGRDGKPARGVLLYRPADARVQRFFLAQRYPRAAQLEQAMAAIAATKPVDLIDLARPGAFARREPGESASFAYCRLASVFVPLK